jgi:hypothetical protein
MRTDRPKAHRHTLFKSLAIAFAAMLPAAADAACDLSHFGERAPRTCARSSQECLPSYLPDPVKEIVRGAVLEWVGLAANDGRASWRALDIDRRELLVIERYAGSRVGRAPRVEPGTPHEYVKASGEGDSRTIDHVRRWPLSPARFDALACIAAGAWSPRPMPVREVTDSAGRFYLLLAERAQVDTALGRFTGSPSKFERMVDDIAKRQRPGQTAR